MEVKITYPPVRREKILRRDIVSWGRWMLLLAAFVCAVVNLATGGTAWALLCFWGLWVAWNYVVAPDLVEYNRLRSWCRMVERVCILLWILDFLFHGSLSVTVVPILCFSGILVAGILFFTDLQRQRHNMMPMLLLAVFCLVFFFFRLALGPLTWADITTGACAAVLLAACMVVLRGDFLRELEKRFHTR